jgi:hypothetical protein
VLQVSLALEVYSSCSSLQPKKGETTLNRNTHFKLYIRLRSGFQRKRLQARGLFVGTPRRTELADTKDIGVGQLAWSYRGPNGDSHLYTKVQSKGAWRAARLKREEGRREKKERIAQLKALVKVAGGGGDSADVR